MKDEDEDEDIDRRIDSTEALEEDLQDFSKPMVIIGGDVVSLYPNLDKEKIVENLDNMIRESGIKWSNVDMMEGVRYLALNWSREQVRNSNLKRIIPWRRSRKGVKPGMRGVGPHGKEPGGQEQWEFPSVVLEDWEREQVIMEVIKIAVTTMFSKHYYGFGGKMFHQTKGGPIGPRGTCAIARITMQWFDIKWEERLNSLRLQFWLNGRYMDDIRIFLPPIKPGWRWEEGRVVYSKRWEELDKDLDLNKICTKFAQDLPEICIRFA